MPIVCPAILAIDKTEYHSQVAKIAHVASRIQIDLTDGIFTPRHTIRSEEAWWPAGFLADFHLMYVDPLPAIQKILQHKPHLIIVHAEAEGDFDKVLSLCRNHSAKVGIALLPQTNPEAIFPVLSEIDHVLIFSGDLGRFGGQADLGNLEKVKALKAHRPSLEVGWDGGVNDQNISELVFGGIDVLNVGGYIQNSDNPERAFHTLERIAEETGTT